MARYFGVLALLACGLAISPAAGAPSVSTLPPPASSVPGGAVAGDLSAPSDLLNRSAIDLDEYFIEGDSSDLPMGYPGADWVWQILPEGLIYEAYLAGMKESRMMGNLVHVDGEGWKIDATAGGRVGLLRLGSLHPGRPEGIQLDVEGSAQLRLDPESRMDFDAVDFRTGLPLSFGAGRTRWKFGYYHLSSHVGDEYLLKHPGFPRLNFARDVLILGHSLYLSPRTRAYFEMGWAFYSDISEPWEFQFGLDHAPVTATGPRGAPFWALNAHFRQELDFGGTFTAQTGWAWRSDVSSPLFRAGFHYYNGKSNHFSFYNEHEQQFGMAVWYDF